MQLIHGIQGPFYCPPLHVAFLLACVGLGLLSKKKHKNGSKKYLKIQLSLPWISPTRPTCTLLQRCKILQQLTLFCSSISSDPIPTTDSSNSSMGRTTSDSNTSATTSDSSTR